MATTKQEQIHTHLMGALGSVFGAKAALLHGGEITIEILDTIRADIDAAMELNGNHSGT